MSTVIVIPQSSTLTAPQKRKADDMTEATCGAATASLVGVGEKQKKRRKTLPLYRSYCDHRDRKTHTQCTAYATHVSRSEFLYCDAHYKKTYGGRLIGPAEAQLYREKRRFALHRHLWLELAEINRRNEQPGQLTVARVGQLMAPEVCAGVMNVVLSETLHGPGCAMEMRELCAERLGPVKLFNRAKRRYIECALLANFASYGMVYPFELSSQSEVTQTFYESRCNGYESTVPKREKLPPAFVDAHRFIRGACEPLFFLWEDLESGEERRLPPRESRALLFALYEKMVRKTPQFELLQTQIKTGHNLCLASDEYKFKDCSIVALQRYYDASSPKLNFHLALLFMLQSEDRTLYPWFASSL